MSEAYCDVDFDGATDDGEPISDHRTNWLKARVPHKCIECRSPIAVGERFRRDSYVCDGQLMVERRCDPCAEVMGEFDFRAFGGYLWEYFGMEWDNGANVQGCMNRLTTVRAKQLMHQRWLKWKGLR